MGSQSWVLPYIGTEKQPLCVHGSTERGTMYLPGRGGCWKQFLTKCSLISVPQMHHRTPHSGLSWIYKVTNTMPVKADPAICTSANDISGVGLSCVGKHEFQFLRYYVWFLQIKPHNYVCQVGDSHMCYTHGHHLYMLHLFKL